MLGIGAGSVVAFLVLFGFVRYQTGVGDTQFFRSMISDHSGAILMCQEASLTQIPRYRPCAVAS